MPYAFPAPTAEALADLRKAAKYLDRIADTALSDEAHSIARAHAIKAWNAIDRFEELASLVEELAGARPIGLELH